MPNRFWSRLTRSQSTHQLLDDSDDLSVNEAHDTIATGHGKAAPFTKATKVAKKAKPKTKSALSSHNASNAPLSDDSPVARFFNHFGKRRGVQLPPIDTSFGGPRNSVWSKHVKTKFKEEFELPSSPPPEHPPAPVPYIYEGQQMRVQTSGHFREHPLVRNNSADVLYHRGCRSLSQITEVDETVAVERGGRVQRYADQRAKERAAREARQSNWISPLSLMRSMGWGARWRSQS